MTIIDNLNTDFQKELYQLLSQDEPDDDNLCLISNLSLEENHIELYCGHKFNYNSIFQEIKYQKQQYHNLETQKLSHSEIKCPYCRTIQKGLLPCRNNYKNLHGVNWPKKYQYKPHICSYTFLSGKKKGIPCGKKCFDKYCDGHHKIIQVREAKKVTKQNTEIINISPNTCKYIFKKGKKKDIQCTCKKTDEDNFCKSHHKK